MFIKKILVVLFFVGSTMAIPIKINPNFGMGYVGETIIMDTLPSYVNLGAAARPFIWGGSLNFKLDKPIYTLFPFFSLGYYDGSWQSKVHSPNAFFYYRKHINLNFGIEKYFFLEKSKLGLGFGGGYNNNRYTLGQGTIKKSFDQKYNLAPLFRINFLKKLGARFSVIINYEMILKAGESYILQVGEYGLWVYPTIFNQFFELGIEL